MLNLQLDNATGDNKNRFVFTFCSLLTYHGVFQEVYINFLIVGHTHDDIDALFGRWSYKFKGNDYLTLLLLMKSFTESRPVNPHLIEEVPDFKKFVEGYLCTGRDALAGYIDCRTPCKCLLFDIFLSMKETARKPLTLHLQGSRCTNPTWATPM